MRLDSDGFLQEIEKVMEWLEGLGLLGLFLGAFMAATIVPFSSDAIYLGVLAATGNPLGCLVAGTLGNWLGSVLGYWIGWMGKWEWMEKWFKVKPETLQKQKEKIDRFGVWLALICWFPIIGDVIAIGLGFYKTKPFWTILLMFVGKLLRFLVWNLVYGLF